MAKVPIFPIPGFVRTEAISTHVKGQKPCNTLAFIRCMAKGRPYSAAFPEDYDRYKLRITTDFQIANVGKANHEWYQSNTRVSASAVMTKLNMSTDGEFTFAFESIDSDVDENGRIVFDVQVMMSALADDGYVALDCTVFLSAWVLFYEARPELPASGDFGKRLGLERITYFPSELRKP